MLGLRIGLLALGALLPLACGSSINQTKCEAACRPPSTGACATASSSTCVSDCVAATAGLSTLCVQCMTERGSWTASPGSGPGPDGGGGTAGTCTGFRLESATSSNCLPVCAQDGG
ncbi:MAG: hypothetical protein ACOZIN_11860 [Myxococcota bacterium]